MSSSLPSAKQALADAVQLSQAARLLFDLAAVRWYAAVAVEGVAVVVAGAIALLSLGGDAGLYASGISMVLLLGGYALRLWAEDAHDVAETMRRQAAISEGLAWPIDRLQLSDWLRRAGRTVRARAAAEPRDDDYYSSPLRPGPERLARMTLESAFYTRHMQLWMRTWTVVATAFVIAVVGFILYVSLSQTVPVAVDRLVAGVVSIIVPLAVSANLVGWALSLSRTATAIRSIEEGLERTLHSAPTDASVVRLVAEYDSQLARSRPVHPAFFRWKHDELAELWRHRSS